MKKTKLLSSISILALILSLGACSLDDDTKDNDIDTNEDETVTPDSLIEDAYNAGNYTMTLELGDYYSKSISYSDYQSGNYDLNDLLVDMTWSYSYIYTLSYTEDAVLCELSIDNGDGAYARQSILYINVYDDIYGPCKYCFVSEYGGDFECVGYYYYYWESTFYSLFYLYESRLAEPEDYSFVESGIDGGVAYDLYDVTSYYPGYYLLLCSGLNWAGSSPEDWAYDFEFDGIYVYPSLHEMDSRFFETYFATYDYTQSFIVQDRVNARLSNIGTTDLSDLTDECLAMIS